ncbi:GNAT family N-acetyltransferase [Synechococcus sp. BA-132 BA5]|nr:GNAT family N-acetyltransferase [Synechococcus sp. BA-132 BA5]
MRVPAVLTPSPLPAPTLIQLTPEHAGACLELDRAALGGIWSLAQWQRELEEQARPCLGLCQGLDLLAMACGWLVVDELHITLVAVAREHRRRGLGRRILEELMQTGFRRGATRATLEVAARNGPGKGLYEALGFRTAGIRHGYYRNGEDALIQWVNLNR